MQRGFTPIFILIGILIAAGLVGGAFYLGKSQSTKPVTQNPIITPSTPPTSVLQTPSPSMDETINWKTYTNAKASFQVKYPSRYSKPGLPSGAAGSPPIYADENSIGDIIFGETSTDSFSVVVLPFSGSIQELLVSTEAKGRPPYNWVSSDNILITSKDILIDGVNAKWLTSSYKMGVKDTYTAIFFTKGNYGFIINPSPNHDEMEINQILSTFKFTN